MLVTLNHLGSDVCRQRLDHNATFSPNSLAQIIAQRFELLHKDWIQRLLNQDHSSLLCVQCVGFLSLAPVRLPLCQAKYCLQSAQTFTFIAVEAAQLVCSCCTCRGSHCCQALLCCGLLLVSNISIFADFLKSLAS